MKILLPIDDSDISEAAIRAVKTYARSQDSQVRVLHVIEPMPAGYDPQTMGPVADPAMVVVLDEQKSDAEELVRRAAQELKSAGLDVRTAVETGDAKHAILNVAAEWHPDLIVVGSHGRKGLDRLLLGSVSEAIARRAACSVLIVKIPAT